MIIFITTRGHQGTLRTLVEGEPGMDLPKIVCWTYDTLFGTMEFPQATYIFADIERLYPWECRLAASVYRKLKDAGLRCLNDPARIPGRYGLLRMLHAAGLNPFEIYRADEPARRSRLAGLLRRTARPPQYPQPRRFPVFVRNEQDHGRPFGGLLGSQRKLEEQLSGLVEKGIPLRGLVVVEFCGQPIAPGIWRKFGTFRIGERIHVDHHVTQDQWTVKHGTPGLCPEWLYVVENDIVLANRYPDAVAQAFRLSGIEYGRADHGIVGGRDVIYEINTNPFLRASAPQRSPTRDRTLAHARRVMAEGLRAIDSGDGAMLSIDTGPRLARFRDAPETPGLARRP